MPIRVPPPPACRSATCCAVAAGVQVGDVLRSLDGVILDGGATLQRKVGDYRWGDSAKLSIERDGKPLMLELNFRRRP